MCYEFLFKDRDQEIEALSAALEKRESVSTPAPAPPNAEGPRRSQRRTAQTDVSRLSAELDQCRSELLAKTQGAARVKHCSDCVMVLWY